jgi:hypothetical protein
MQHSIFASILSAVLGILVPAGAVNAASSSATVGATLVAPVQLGISTTQRVTLVQAPKTSPKGTHISMQDSTVKGHVVWAAPLELAHTATLDAHSLVAKGSGAALLRLEHVEVVSTESKGITITARAILSPGLPAGVYELQVPLTLNFN